MKEYDLKDFEQGYGNRFQQFQDLARHRIHNILLVSSMYDSFILTEDGTLYESLLNEYVGLNLRDTPSIKRVSSGNEAIARALTERRYDLIITSLRLDDMPATDFARAVRRAGIEVPIVLLTYDSQALSGLGAHQDLSVFDRVFLWQGDFRIFLAITKCIEDELNVEHDTNLVGLQCIILIEDNIRFYSSYLPIIYTELMGHSQSLIAEGVNPAHRLLRMRARPKILHCDTYEKAWEYYEKYHDHILGVISDMQFPRRGELDPHAGIDLARSIQVSHPDIPILLQSRDPKSKALADKLDVSFLVKGSPTLLKDLRRFMKEKFFFGDFRFCLPDGTEVGKAKNLRALEKMLHIVPEESIRYHGEHNHFSNWLKARTEFLLAYKLRPRRVSDYASMHDLRQYLINCIRDLRHSQQRGSIVDFDANNFDEDDSFARIGGGSLGGKGRGLAFVNSMIVNYMLRDRFDGICVSVPATVVVGTDVFDQFIADNNLWDLALISPDDDKIERRFLNAQFPPEIAESLRAYLRIVDYPLAVRSSSLLEDSQYQPFAGIYKTYMLPNNNEDPAVRADELLRAIKLVYASMFSQNAKSYINATPFRLEEEKMAVLVQKLVGTQHDARFYPDFAGAASSHNFYPIPPAEADDGIASVALGLGATVMDGEPAVRFSPAYPQSVVQFSTTDEMLRNSQRNFLSLELPSAGADAAAKREFKLVRQPLSLAESDGTLVHVASTYSPDNDAIYDGVSRDGPRVVTFAPILKHDKYPLPEILSLILKFGRRGMNSPVEIEFAASVNESESERSDFSVLQLRPMVVSHEWDELEIGETVKDNVICRSSAVLGNGVITNIHDIVYVDIERFDRSESRAVADEIARLNRELVASDAPYLLIGVGRWGSADPWLGIPVSWESISGARVMVETGFKDMLVTPSQGTHFFQNLVSFRIGYFTVTPGAADSFVDWQWLRDQKALTELDFARHLRFATPLTIQMNGRRQEGAIIKPNGFVAPD